MTIERPSVLQPEMPPTRWGDPARATGLPDGVRDLVGLVFPIQDTPARADVEVPAARLAEDLVDGLRAIVGAEHVVTDDALRRRRTRGRSTPDLLRQRSGDLADAPDVVVRPSGHDDVVAVLAYAQERRIAVVPFGGGTAVTGGLVADTEGTGLAGVLSLDLGRMRGLLALDPVSSTASLEPGLRGPEAEALLAEHGLMLGHFPQSFEYATIGGFAATRSSGQSSAGYGRFDAMVVALRVATPVGEVRLGASPANASGPDLRELFLGSEGAFGVITEVTVRVRPLPEVKEYEGWRWASFADGADAMRALAQSDLLPTVIRLSDENETAINLADPESIGGQGDAGGAGQGCQMIVGYEGTPAAVAAKKAAVTEALTALGGAAQGSGPGDAWVHGRFDAPYLRDSLLDVGVLVETLETVTFWGNRENLYLRVKAALQETLGDSAMVLCHISHVYATGCSLYFTVAAPGGADPLATWLPAKAAACEAIVAAGASITHHHAVGTDHRPYLTAEIGEVGAAVLRAVKKAVDPAGVLNPGVLIP
ncbi:FAD-binding oxidoreductase [Nocardioides sp. LHD-245]|uniref:FAD-binding oxidoreductase n=1 Tax=Nocardioides sp. LHD-245 TaxID=3051387 RepID=UPI0027DEAD48|nr:FAD-binding oxidoreductase [Nocardioides sp. LHD-245]